MYTIYKLEKPEYHRYKLHLLSLDEESRYMRFGYQARTEQIIKLCNQWREDSDKHIVFAIQNEDLEVVGVAHISLVDSPAELAFSVLKDYQGQGMGDALMKRAIEYCQNHGIKNGCMVCLGSNDKIKGLARKNGILVKTEYGDSHGEIAIPDPTPVSVWSEAVNDSIAKIDHLGKAQRKFAQMFKFPLTF